MSNRIRGFAAILIVAALMSFTFIIITIPIRSATPGEWYKAVNITSRYREDFASSEFQESVRRAATAGANQIVLVVPYYQSNIYSDDIQPGNNTPTDEVLIQGINFIRSQGLKPSLKIFLDTWEYQWRANINPNNRTEWYRKFGDVLVKYATLSQQHGVDLLCLGTEMVKVSSSRYNSDNNTKWREMISRVRSVYSGKLTYSANWGGVFDEKSEIEFWDALDYIGVSAYFSLSGESTPSVESLKQAWSEIDTNELQPLANKYGKQIIFTEIGYESRDRAFAAPGDWSQDGPFNEQAQANGYEALFSYFSNKNYMAGTHMWEWMSNPNAGGQGDTGFSPQNKLAEQTMKKWYTGTDLGSGGQDIPKPENKPSEVQVSGTFPSATVNIGDQSPVQVTVKNTGQTESNVLVDIEIYNSENQRVFQQYYSEQKTGPGLSQTIVTPWSSQTAGIFTLKIGVFSNSWSTLYSWNDSVAQVIVKNPSEQIPSGNPVIEAWWPTENTVMSGVQPIKAVVQNRNPQDYQMYWRVDGGELISMSNSQEGYPHKESWIDYSGWNWNPEGKYTITLVAKDASQNVLVEKAVAIAVR